MDKDNFRNERMCRNLEAQIAGIDMLLARDEVDEYATKHSAISEIARLAIARPDFKTPQECFNFAEAYVGLENKLYLISLTKRKKAFEKELAEELAKPKIPSELNQFAQEKPAALNISSATMTRRINDSGSV